MIADAHMDLLPSTGHVLILSIVVLLIRTIVGWCRMNKNLPPGPRGLPIVGAALLIALSKDPPHDTFLRWSKIYGKIFSMRVGKRIIVVLNDFELINEALHHNLILDRPTQTMEAILKSSGADHGVSSGNGLFWREQRKFLHSALRDMGVTRKILEENILSEVENFVQNVTDLGGKPFDPSNLLISAASNVICGIAWGRQYSYDHPELRKLIHIVTIAAQFSISASVLGIFPWLRHVPFGPHVKTLDAFREFHKIIEGQIVERNNCNNNPVTDGSRNDCLLGAYLQEMADAASGRGHLKQPLEKGNVYSNLVNLFFAGSDTIAMTLSWSLIYLLRYPAVQVKCHDELDTVVGRDRAPCSSDRSQLPYLEATIAEVQRISNVTPLGIPRSASHDVSLHGHLIPKKAMIIANMQAVMFDPAIWKQPKEFKPERFLGVHGEFVKSPKLIIFGTGPRKCLGEQLAQMELFMFLATILHRFEFTVPPGEAMPSKEGVTGVTVKPHPYKICATCRLTDDPVPS